MSVLMVATLSAGASANTATPTPTPDAGASPGPNCKVASWSPEEYRLYGDKKVIIHKLDKIPIQLSEHRIFVQVTQGQSTADVKLYQQQEDGTFTVTEWTTKQISRLLADIDDTIVANKGVNCVGEQVKGVLTKHLQQGKVLKAVPAPVSLQAAFAHSIKGAQGDFIGFVLIPLC